MKTSEATKQTQRILFILISCLLRIAAEEKWFLGVIWMSYARYERPEHPSFFHLDWPNCDGKKYSAGRHAAIPRRVSRAHHKVQRAYTKV